MMRGKAEKLCLKGRAGDGFEYADSIFRGVSRVYYRVSFLSPVFECFTSKVLLAAMLQEAVVTCLVQMRRSTLEFVGYCLHSNKWD